LIDKKSSKIPSPVYENSFKRKPIFLAQHLNRMNLGNGQSEIKKQPTRYYDDQIKQLTREDKHVYIEDVELWNGLYKRTKCSA